MAAPLPQMPPGPPPQPPVRQVPPPPPGVPADLVDQYAIGKLMSQIAAADPAKRKVLLGYIKQAAPDLPIPELDLQQQFTAQMEESQKTQQERIKAIEDSLAKLTGGEQRRLWRDQHDLTEEELTDVEKFAKEKKIGDPEAALEYHRMSALGRPRGTTVETEMTAEDRRLLYTKPKDWYTREANKVLKDMRLRRRGA